MRNVQEARNVLLKDAPSGAVAEFEAAVREECAAELDQVIAAKDFAEAHEREYRALSQDLEQRLADAIEAIEIVVNDRDVLQASLDLEKALC